MEASASSAGIVLIERLDDGYPEEPGDYHCTSCGWQKKGVRRYAARNHQHNRHPGQSFRLERLVKMKPRVEKKVMGRPRLLTDGVDARTIRSRQADRHHRERKKVSLEWSFSVNNR